MEYHATAIAWYSTGGYCQKAKPPTNIPRTLWEYRHSRKFFECQYCPKIATTIVHSWQQGAKWFYDEIENDKIASVHRLLSQYSLLAGSSPRGLGRFDLLGGSISGYVRRLCKTAFVKQGHGILYPSHLICRDFSTPPVKVVRNSIPLPRNSIPLPRPLIMMDP